MIVCVYIYIIQKYDMLRLLKDLHPTNELYHSFYIHFFCFVNYLIWFCNSRWRQLKIKVFRNKKKILDCVIINK